MGVEECGTVVLEPGDRLFGSEIDVLLPAFHGYLAVLGVDGEDELIFAKLLIKSSGEVEIDDGVFLAVCGVVSTEERATVDDAFGAEIEETLAVIGCLQSAANLAGELTGEAGDEVGVRALSHGCVEIDELNERVLAETVDPVIEVVEGEFELFTLYELDDLAVHEIYGWDEHLAFSSWLLASSLLLRKFDEESSHNCSVTERSVFLRLLHKFVISTEGEAVVEKPAGKS